MSTTTVRCCGYERAVVTEALDYYRTHYGNKGEEYCRSQLGHVKHQLPTKLAEAFVIQERLDQLAKGV